MVTFHVITLFPDAVRAYVDESIIGRAQLKKHIKVLYYNPRDFTDDTRRRVDRRPYGGGPGMVLLAEPVLRAAEKAIGRKRNAVVLFFSPSGTPFTGEYAHRLAARAKHIVLIAGHYEGVDARVARILKAKKVSIGPYTLSGGEVPAMAVIDAVSRFVPGVLGNKVSLEEGRTASADVYTRPEALRHRGKVYRVPRILLSGAHADIEKWKRAKQRGLPKR